MIYEIKKADIETLREAEKILTKINNSIRYNCNKDDYFIFENTLLDNPGFWSSISEKAKTIKSKID